MAVYSFVLEMLKSMT